MSDTWDAVEALLGLSEAAVSGESGGTNHDATAAKRKRDESSSLASSSVCGLCNKQYPIEDGGEISSPSLSLDCCRTCLRNASLFFANTSFTRSQDEGRSRSPVQDIYLGLHGMEVAEASMLCMSSFLSKTERALFGVALDPTGPNIVSEMVTGKNVVELDFGDIHPNLAARLTDEHLNSILIAIKAKDHLKVLKLTNCVGMNGRGLEPLRDSRALELIDVSLLKLHEAPIVESRSAICESLVLPVLNSILQQGELSKLKHIQLHKNWKERSSPWFQDFMSSYEQFLNQESRRFCTVCNRPSHEGVTCYLCLEYTCKICSQSDQEAGHMQGSHCFDCEKSFCPKCVHFRPCQGDQCVHAQNNHCIECTKVCESCKLPQCSSCTVGGSCFTCGNSFCGHFGTDCLGEKCIECNKSFCDQCVEFDFCCCGAARCPDCTSDELCRH